MHLIDRELGRSHGTILRRFARNADPDGAYEDRAAQRCSVERRHIASTRPHIAAARWARVEARLREDWGLEQIAGSGGVAMSHKPMYQHIAHDRQRSGTLSTHLRWRKRSHRHRCGTPQERQRFHAPVP